jgi:hypothetical protein
MGSDAIMQEVAICQQKLCNQGGGKTEQCNAYADFVDVCNTYLPADNQMADAYWQNIYQCPTTSDDVKTQVVPNGKSGPPSTGGRSSPNGKSDSGTVNIQITANNGNDVKDKSFGDFNGWQWPPKGWAPHLPFQHFCEFWPKSKKIWKPIGLKLNIH